MSGHIPSVRSVRLLRRQVGQLLAIQRTPAQYFSTPDQALSISIVRSIHQATAPWCAVEGRKRLTREWPLFFAFTLEKLHKVTEGPWRRWGLTKMEAATFDKPFSGRLPKSFSVTPVEREGLEVVARELDGALGGIRVLSPDEARDLFFYEEARKPKEQKLADKEILAKAKENPEWKCNMSIQNMRKRRDKYQERNGLPPIAKRKHKRS
jgi:hypothetical protein